VPTATALAEATATPVPEVAADFRKDWVNYLLNHPGYKPAWGTPQYGGTARWTGISATTTSWLSGYPGWGCCAQGSMEAYNGLLAMDPWGSIRDGPICDLCESWSVSADGLTYTFKLRQGVKFQSEGWGKDKGAPAEAYGAELTCEDVKASHEWIASPPATELLSFASRHRSYFAHFKDVTCPDGPNGYTAVLNFKYYKNATTATLASGVRIWNKEYREWVDAQWPGIMTTAKEEGYLLQHGTGPFIPTFGDSYRVMKSKKNPNYFIEGAPFLDNFESFLIGDPNTKFASLLTGKLTSIGPGSSGITKPQAIQVQTTYRDKIELYVMPYNHIQVLMLNPLRPPFDDWKVRWAVNLALDRQDWIRFQKAGDAPMASPAWYFHPDNGWNIPEKEFSTFPGFRQDKKDEDIAEANRLLDEAFGKGVRPRVDQYVITLFSRREPSLWGIDFFRKHLNWEFNVKYVDTYGPIANECLYTLRTEASTVMQQTLSAAPGDAIQGIHSRQTTQPPCYIRGNKTGDLDADIARIDALIEEADSTLDDARRAKLLREIELYMGNERLTSATLSSMNPAWANTFRQKGNKWIEIAPTVLYRVLDRIWMAE
jgi:ABC-type transport system substrate-binding protein